MTVGSGVAEALDARGTVAKTSARGSRTTMLSVFVLMYGGWIVCEVLGCFCNEREVLGRVKVGGKEKLKLDV